MKKSNKLVIIFVIFIVLLLGAGVTGIYYKSKSKTPMNNNKVEKDSYNFEVISRKNENELTLGDEIKLNNEEFYVISSDDMQTTLLAKYNLYVGQIIKETRRDGTLDSWTDAYSYIKTITKDDEKYGLQSPEAQGNIEVEKDAVGVVGFSGDSYWLQNGVLLDKYTNDNIYYSLLNTEPMDMEDNNLIVNNKKYTIAYFVEEYVNRLKGYSKKDISGRLLLVSELNNMGCNLSIEEQGGRCDNVPEWLFSSSYWLGSSALGNE